MKKGVEPIIGKKFVIGVRIGESSTIHRTRLHHISHSLISDVHVHRISLIAILDRTAPIIFYICSLVISAQSDAPYVHL